jgi:phospholipase/carboxylesterase
MPALHDTKGTARFGRPLSQARGAVILVHGRGSSPHDIAGLADVIPGAGLAFLAPAATDGTWYPHRFLSPLERNEPRLSSALSVIDQLVTGVLAAGIAPEQIGLAGFSQGACLVLEYAARHPRRYGFVAGLSGALIGPPDTPRPSGDLSRTPVLLGCAELDAHIPFDYVERSAKVFSLLNADVTKQIFPGAAHAIFPAENDWLKQHALAGG